MGSILCRGKCDNMIDTCCFQALKKIPSAHVAKTTSTWQWQRMRKWVLLCICVLEIVLSVFCAEPKE
jgi:hypothetical protein